MTAATLDHELEAAFVAPPPTAAGLKLRPLTAGTLILLRQTGNAMINGLQAEDDREFHVAAFVYIHAADPAAVRRAAAKPDTFREAVLAFADGLTVSDFADAAGQIQAICEKATAGQNYQVKDNGGDPHPNA